MGSTACLALSQASALQRGQRPNASFGVDLHADDWSLLIACVRTGGPARDVRDPKIPSRWSLDPGAALFFALSWVGKITPPPLKRGIFPREESSVPNMPEDQ